MPLVSQSAISFVFGPTTLTLYPIIFSSGISCLNDSSTPLLKVTAELKVSAVPSIADTVTTPEMLECLTLMPTSIIVLEELNVTEVLLLTAPDIVDSVLCLTCTGGCQLINKSALPLVAVVLEVSIEEVDTEAVKDST